MRGEIPHPQLAITTGLMHAGTAEQSAQRLSIEDRLHKTTTKTTSTTNKHYTLAAKDPKPFFLDRVIHSLDGRQWETMGDNGSGYQFWVEQRIH